MNKYLRIIILITGLWAVMILVTNLIFLKSFSKGEQAPYRVEAKRIMEEMVQNEQLQDPDLSGYDHIISVKVFDPSEICNHDYLVLEDASTGVLYRFEYERPEQTKQMILTLNGVLILVYLIVLGILLYLYHSILKPFQQLKEMPYELSKGNLTTPVKENKNRYFGRFLWGMDLLRENLEEAKEEELRFQKEKKTLILSLSHDIKTPLSSIKLYSRALSQDLYTEEEKKKEAVSGIMRNAEEIENYVSEIISASNDNFLNLKVENGEVYLSELMKKIEVYYRDKLSVKHTEFVVEPYPDCVILGDPDRIIEVMQNIIENAIKYGDGREIRLSVSEEEDCRLVKIENTGEHIRESERSSLFESFYRGSNSAGKKGSGLGLYIARTLMRMMDGDVFLDPSAGEGRTAFVVVLRKA